MRITEEDKKEILNKYKDNTSEEVLRALKRRFPVEESNWELDGVKLKMISVEGKSYWIKEHKKYLVGKIFLILEDKFPDVDTGTLRRTIKFYLDLMK
jgi:hypothetical protein